MCKLMTLWPTRNFHRVKYVIVITDIAINITYSLSQLYKSMLRREVSKIDALAASAAAAFDAGAFVSAS